MVLSRKVDSVELRRLPAYTAVLSYGRALSMIISPFAIVVSGEMYLTTKIRLIRRKGHSMVIGR